MRRRDHNAAAPAVRRRQLTERGNGGVIEAGGWLVQQPQGRWHEYKAGQREASPLSGGKEPRRQVGYFGEANGP